MIGVLNVNQDIIYSNHAAPLTVIKVIAFSWDLMVGAFVVKKITILTIKAAVNLDVLKIIVLK
jgi:hypothetical protein